MEACDRLWNSYNSTISKDVWESPCGLSCVFPWKNPQKNEERGVQSRLASLSSKGLPPHSSEYIPADSGEGNPTQAPRGILPSQKGRILPEPRPPQGVEQPEFFLVAQKTRKLKINEYSRHEADRPRIVKPPFLVLKRDRHHPSDLLFFFPKPYLAHLLLEHELHCIPVRRCQSPFPRQNWFVRPYDHRHRRKR